MHRLLISAAALALFASAQAAFAAPDLQAGADLFNDNCAICHGAKGEGYPASVVPNGAVRIKKLAGDSAYWDFATFKQTVMTGKDDQGPDARHAGVRQGWPLRAAGQDVDGRGSPQHPGLHADLRPQGIRLA